VVTDSATSVEREIEFCERLGVYDPSPVRRRRSRPFSGGDLDVARADR
jgi:hypothetical protein